MKLTPGDGTGPHRRADLVSEREALWADDSDKSGASCLEHLSLGSYLQ